MRLKFTKILKPNIPFGYEAEVLEESDHGYHFLCPDGVVAIMTAAQIEGIAEILNTGEKIEKLKEIIDEKSE